MLKPGLIILLAGLSVSSMLTPALNDFLNFLIGLYLFLAGQKHASASLNRFL